MTILRAVLAACCAAALAAADVPVPTAPAPLLLRFSFPKGGVISLNPDQPSAIDGGVKIGFESVLLTAERLAYGMSPLTAGGPGVLDRADLSGAPGAPVRLDSSASQLPEVTFRGLFTPQQVEIRRLEADPARADEVRYRADLIALDDFWGRLQTEQGWKPFVGWADRAKIEVICTPVPGGALRLSRPRLAAIHLYGRPEAESVPARKAEIMRLTAQPPDPAAGIEAVRALNQHDFRVDGSELSLYFDAAGRLISFRYGDDGTFEGDPQIPVAPGRSRPKVASPAQP